MPDLSLEAIRERLDLAQDLMRSQLDANGKSKVFLDDYRRTGVLVRENLLYWMASSEAGMSFLSLGGRLEIDKTVIYAHRNPLRFHLQRVDQMGVPVRVEIDQDRLFEVIMDLANMIPPELEEIISRGEVRVYQGLGLPAGGSRQMA